ncbi:MAG: aminotransferase class I/II-fold pyridoxal phosphate-dependent enzyme [Planctomycetota bacterium]
MMEITGSKRLRNLGEYAFAAIDARVSELEAEGKAVVDFGVGDPTLPTPEIVRRATAEGIDRWRSAGYPPYDGTAAFREAVAAWTRRRFGVELDPRREICSSIGSKEAIFHFPEAILDPGDLVILPDPGYPPYSRGTLFAEGEPYPVPIREENGFLPDLDAIPTEVARRAKVFWLTHPNSPAGRVAPPDYLGRWIDYCRRHGIIAASDEAYSEIYFTEEPPHSALELGREGVVVFQSLSKRSAMTGYRIGWVAGDKRIIALFRKVKTNIDSGTPFFVQEGAIAALGDETHVAQTRSGYRARRDLLVRAFERAGCPRSEPEATLYIWQRVPPGLSSTHFAERLLDPRIAAVTIPSAALRALPGEGLGGAEHVRLTLVPSLEDCKRVARAIEEYLDV